MKTCAGIGKLPCVCVNPAVLLVGNIVTCASIEELVLMKRVVPRVESIVFFMIETSAGIEEFVLMKTALPLLLTFI